MAHQKISLPVMALVASLGAAPTHAQTTASKLGGGFLELLITGRDPTPRPWLARPAAPATRAPQADKERPAPDRPAAIGARSAALAPAQIEAEDARAIVTKFTRQEVAYHGPQGAGAIVVDTPRRCLFLVLGNGKALRYGIGVGRPGFEWAGVKSVTRKAEWPGWTPPPEMRKRRPELPQHMAGGLDNPLGARALYLGSSLYRIHGTNEPHTIGHNVSSGCIRMMNEDVIDLYERVGVGTKVLVI